MSAARFRRAPALRCLEQRPEPARFWLRHVPDSWSAPHGCWTDLARGSLGRGGENGSPHGWPPAGLADLVYVPPGGVPAVGTGGVSLLQLLPGTTGPPAAWVVYDLLPALLEGSLAALAELPPGSSAAWPLIAGVTDGEALWRDGLQRLAAARVSHVQPVALALTGHDKRWLAGWAGAGAFGALFHGPAPSERWFAAVARSMGLRAFAPRPVVGVTGRAAANRRLAGAAALAGELWVRCGRAESEGQALLRAARWLDETGVDVSALVREGNLSIVPWLSEGSEALVRGLVVEGKAPLVDELEEEYAAAGVAG